MWKKHKQAIRGPQGGQQEANKIHPKDKQFRTNTIINILSDRTKHTQINHTSTKQYDL